MVESFFSLFLPWASPPKLQNKLYIKIALKLPPVIFYPLFTTGTTTPSYYFFGQSFPLQIALYIFHTNSLTSLPLYFYTSFTMPFFFADFPFFNFFITLSFFLLLIFSFLSSSFLILPPSLLILYFTPPTPPSSILSILPS